MDLIRLINTAILLLHFVIRSSRSSLQVFPSVLNYRFHFPAAALMGAVQIKIVYL